MCCCAQAHIFFDDFFSVTSQFETDQFDEETPLGVKTFTNLVFTEKSNLADERLVIAAHYDSKYFPPDKQQFVGATDSAVPCAYMIAVAKTLHSYLQKQLGSRKIYFFYKKKKNL